MAIRRGLYIVRTMQSNYNKLSSFKYLVKPRFEAIYRLTLLDKPSWEIVGIEVLGKPITEQEFEFVIKHTRGKFS